MRHVTVYTTDKEYEHFIALAKSLPYVTKIEEDDGDTKEEIVENLKTGLKDVKLFKEGKLTTISAREFLDGL